MCIIPFNPHNQLWHRYCQHPHFSQEGTEVDTWEATCPSSHIRKWLSQVCSISKPRPSATRSAASTQGEVLVWASSGPGRKVSDRWQRVEGNRGAKSQCTGGVESKTRLGSAVAAPSAWEGRFPGNRHMSPCSKIPQKGFLTEERKALKKWTAGYKITNYSTENRKLNQLIRFNLCLSSPASIEISVMHRDSLMDCILEGHIRKIEKGTCNPG